MPTTRSGAATRKAFGSRTVCRGAAQTTAATPMTIATAPSASSTPTRSRSFTLATPSNTSWVVERSGCTTVIGASASERI
jgi:hypothetical protein